MPGRKEVSGIAVAGVSGILLLVGGAAAARAAPSGWDVFVLC
jgi:hypothetical protein